MMYQVRMVMISWPSTEWSHVNTDIGCFAGGISDQLAWPGLARARWPALLQHLACTGQAQLSAI